MPGGPRLAYAALPLDERLSWAGFGEYRPGTATPVANVQKYRPRPAVWKVADRDTTLYLFGTLHSLPIGLEWRTPVLDRIMGEAQSLIVESLDEPSAPGAERGADVRRPALALRLPPHRRAALARLLAQERPGAAALLDAAPTWVAAIAVRGLRERMAGMRQGPGADAWLEDAFRQAGKTITGIERSEALVARLNAISEPGQRHLLDTAIDGPTPTLAQRMASVDAWARGDIGTGSPLAKALAKDARSPLNGPLVADRNRAWARSLARRMRTPGTALFAAGIGHFIGKESLIARLRLYGIYAQRVQ